MSILGVVMAGGRNTRFGDLKAFARIGEQRIVDRVIAALHTVTTDVVLSANDPASYEQLGLELRADTHPDLGALGGIYTALLWAVERGHQGVIAVACDMPFPSASLLREILTRSANYDAVLPESDGRRGLEPLFAYYSIDCIPAIKAAIARDDRRMISFHADVNLHRLPLADVRQHGDPDLIFMNVNTREELERARELAS